MPTNHSGLDDAVRKIASVRDAMRSIVALTYIDQLTDAISLINRHPCPVPPEPPKPAYVFKVGQVLRLSAEIDALPFDAVVRTNTHRTAEKRPGGWQATTFCAGLGHTVIETELFGAKIIYLPEES